MWSVKAARDGALIVIAVCAAPLVSRACVVGTGMGTCTEAALNLCLPDTVSGGDARGGSLASSARTRRN
jgi:hypothetical protein